MSTINDKLWQELMEAMPIKKKTAVLPGALLPRDMALDLLLELEPLVQKAIKLGTTAKERNDARRLLARVRKATA